MTRIVALSRKTVGATGSDTSGLMEEVSVDYVRTMNKIAMQTQIKEVNRRLERAAGV